jgi:hypothetical protein
MIRNPWSDIWLYRTLPGTSTKTLSAASAAAQFGGKQISCKSCFISAASKAGTLSQYVYWSYGPYADVGMLEPTSLFARTGEDLLERAVANRNFKSNAQPTAFQVDGDSRQLCALSRTPLWKPMSSFSPSGVARSSISMQSL